MSPTPESTRPDPATRSAPPAHPRRADPELLPWAWLAGLAALQFALDLALAPRVLGEGDAAEFTLALALGGVPHPSGYPLYVLAGYPFVHLLHACGVGWPLAANLWSAVGAAMATLLTAALADRLLPAQAGLGRGARLAVVAAALVALAANPVFLRAATQAEVYSGHVAWVAAAALLALRLGRGLAPGVPAARVRAGALAWGLLCGLGLAHHLTSMLFAVPLSLHLALATARARRLEASLLPAFLAGLAAPLLAYGFLAWRALHPAAVQWPLLEPGLGGVLAHASGAIYRPLVGGFAPSPAETSLLLAAVAPVVLPGLVAAVAVALAARRDPEGPFLAALALGGALQVAFALRYGVIDPSAYFLPAIVVAVVAAARLLAIASASRTSPGLARGFALAAMLLVAWAWVPPEFDHARRVAEVDDQVRAAFRALPFRRGIVVWHSDSHVRLRAYQVLDGEQPGLIVLDPAVLTWEPARREQTRLLGFDPLAGMRLASDRDLAGVTANIARQTSLPVVDFAQWWARAGVSP